MRRLLMILCATLGYSGTVLAESSYSMFHVAPSQYYGFAKSQVETYAGYTQFRLGADTDEGEVFAADQQGQTVGVATTIRSDKSLLLNLQAVQTRTTTTYDGDDDEYAMTTNTLAPSVTAHVKNSIAVGLGFTYQRDDLDEDTSTRRFITLSAAKYGKKGEVGLSWKPGHSTENVPEEGAAFATENPPEWLLHGKLLANSTNTVHSSIRRIQYGAIDESDRALNEKDVYLYTLGLKSQLSSAVALGVAGIHQAAGYDSRQDAYFGNMANNTLVVETQAQLGQTMKVGIQVTATRAEEDIAGDGAQDDKVTYSLEGETVALSMGVVF